MSRAVSKVEGAHRRANTFHATEFDPRYLSFSAFKSSTGIELLRIYALVCTTRMLVFVGLAADGFSKAALRDGTRIADYLTAWMNARDAAGQRVVASKLDPPGGR
jgi:hypothetical protein